VVAVVLQIFRGVAFQICGSVRLKARRPTDV